MRDGPRVMDSARSSRTPRIMVFPTNLNDAARSGLDPRSITCKIKPSSVKMLQRSEGSLQVWRTFRPSAGIRRCAANFRDR